MRQTLAKLCEKQRRKWRLEFPRECSSISTDHNYTQSENRQRQGKQVALSVICVRCLGPS